MAVGRALQHLFELAYEHEGAGYSRDLRAGILGIHTDGFYVTRVEGDAPSWVREFLNKRMRDEMAQTIEMLDAMHQSLEKRHDVAVETEDGLVFAFEDVPVTFDAEMAVEALCLFANEVQQIRLSMGEDAARRYFETGWQPHVDRIMFEFERQQDIRRRRMLNGDGEVIQFDPRARRSRKTGGCTMPPPPPPKSA